MAACGPGPPIYAEMTTTHGPPMYSEMTISHGPPIYGEVTSLNPHNHLYMHYPTTLFDAMSPHIISHDETDTLQILDQQPGHGLSTKGLFDLQGCLGDEHEAMTSMTLYGGLIESKVTMDGLDIQLGIPALYPHLDSGRAFEIKIPKMAETSEDEGFASVSSSMTNLDDHAHSEVEEVEVWDEAQLWTSRHFNWESRGRHSHDDYALSEVEEVVAQLWTSQHFTWESRGRHIQTTERPYLSEAPPTAVDHLYLLRQKTASLLLSPAVKPPVLREISETHLIRDLVNVMLAVPSTTFMFSEDSEHIILSGDFYVSGITPESLRSFVHDFCVCGENYHKLSRLSYPQVLDSFYQDGLVFQAFTDALRSYVRHYQGTVLSIKEGITLSRLKLACGRLFRQLDFLVGLCRIGDNDPLPRGVKLITYLYKETQQAHHTDHFTLMLALLKASCVPYCLFFLDENKDHMEPCKQYHRLTLSDRCHSRITAYSVSADGPGPTKDLMTYPLFIQEWVFHGVHRDIYGEFLINFNMDAVHHRDKSYWLQAYTMTPVDTNTIPEFLCDLANDIFVCGKSLNLLKICNAQHFLCNVDSSDIPRMSVTFSQADVTMVQQSSDAYYQRMQEIAKQRSITREDVKRKLEERCRELMATAKDVAQKEIQMLQNEIDERKRKAKEKKQKELEELKSQLYKDTQRRSASEEAEKAADKQIMDKLTKTQKDWTDQQTVLELQAREELIAHYSTLADDAVSREQRALWRIKRHHLDDVRREFLLKDRQRWAREALTGHQQDAQIPEIIVTTPRKSEEINKTDNTSDRSATGLPLEPKSDTTISVDDVKNDDSLMKEPIKSDIKVGKLIDFDITPDVQLEVNEKDGVDTPTILHHNGVNDAHVGQLIDLNVTAEILSVNDTQNNVAFSDTVDDIRESNLSDADEQTDDDGTGPSSVSSTYLNDANRHFETDATGPSSVSSTYLNDANKHLEMDGSGVKSEVQKALSIVLNDNLGNKVNTTTGGTKKQVYTAFGEGMGGDNKDSDSIDGKRAVMNTDTERESDRNTVNIEIVSGVESTLERQFEVFDDAEKISTAKQSSEIKSLITKQSDEQLLRPTIKTVPNKHISMHSTSDVEKTQIKLTQNRHPSIESSPEKQIRPGIKIFETRETTPDPHNIDFLKRFVKTVDGRNSTVQTESLEWTIKPCNKFGHVSQLCDINETSLIPRRKKTTAFHVGQQSNFRDYGIASQSELSTLTDHTDGMYQPKVRINTDMQATTESQFVDLEKLRLARFSRLNVYGHASDSSVQRLMYADRFEEVDADPENETSMTAETDTVFDDSHKMVLLPCEAYTDQFSILDDYPNLDCAFTNAVMRRSTSPVKLSEPPLHHYIPLAGLMRKAIESPLYAQVSLVNRALLDYFHVDLRVDDHFDALRRFLFMEDGDFSQILSDSLFDKLFESSQFSQVFNPLLHHILVKLFESSKFSQVFNPLFLHHILVKAVRTSHHGNGGFTLFESSQFSQVFNPLFLHHILVKAVRTSHHGNDGFIDRLSFALKQLPAVFNTNSNSLINCLELQYKVEWPVNIVISDSCLQKYYAVFTFMLTLKKAVWVLRDVWQHLKRDGTVHGAVRSPQFTKIQQFRQEMQHFVRVMQSYIVNQIIHVSWTEFQAALTSVENLDGLRHAHVDYLNKVVFRCLLNKKASAILQIIDNIFASVTLFRAQLVASSWQLHKSGDIINTHFENLSKSHRAFHENSAFLYAVVKKLSHRGYEPHFQDLLLRLNFNHFYDKHKQ